jgi:hypothetical protein
MALQCCALCFVSYNDMFLLLAPSSCGLCRALTPAMPWLCPQMADQLEIKSWLDEFMIRGAYEGSTGKALLQRDLNSAEHTRHLAEVHLGLRTTQLLQGMGIDAAAKSAAAQAQQALQQQQPAWQRKHQQDTATAAQQQA